MRDDLALSGVEPRYQIVRLGLKTTRTGQNGIVWYGVEFQMDRMVR